MFDYGQKIIVTNSSHRGKIGPRKGSVGYVLGSNSSRIVKETINRVPFCAESQRVIFVRYGFGKERKESETRRVINVFPILSSYGQVPYKKEAFKMFIEEVEGKSENVWPTTRWAIKNKTNTPICMLHPLENTEDIRDLNETNFKAWYKSIIKSWTFSEGLNKTRPDFRQSKYEAKARDYFKAIRNSATSRNYREKIFTAAFGSDKVKREVIYAIKYLQSMFMVMQLKRYTNSMLTGYDNNVYNDGPFLKRDLIYPALTSLVFNPSVLKLNFELMKNRGLDCNKLEKGLKQTLHLMRENALPLYSIKS